MGIDIMSMIDWDAVAHRLGHLNEKALWENLYVDRKLSISELAEQFGVGRSTIRSSLIRNEIEIRERGGPNHRTAPAGPADLEQQITRDGVAAVAARLGISTAAVYKRMKRLRETRKGA
jgi:transposase-like protein